MSIIIFISKFNIVMYSRFLIVDNLSHFQLNKDKAKCDSYYLSFDNHTGVHSYR